MTDISAPPRPDADYEKRLQDEREEYRQKIQIGRALDGANEATKQHRINMLARLIFAEAANHHDRPDAMEAIGWAAINRVGAPTFPKTLEEVILKPKQFAAGSRLWNAAAATLRGPDATAYSRALKVAQGILGREIRDPISGARFFYSSRPDDQEPEGFFAMA